MTCFAVTRIRGAAWKPDTPMRQQSHWIEHAAFMNRMAAEGFVVLGGPLGDGERVLLVIEAASPDVVRVRLGADPWSESHLLEIASIEPWTILLDSRDRAV